MRFTVHDSPDYYQLKVSVFNDDKKTELIGETYVTLEQIIIPGGGQNDVWHTLNCKGRYAGEIRIELTYYDTRPREEKAEKRRQSAPMDVSTGQAASSVGGPRQPKPVKRRPLPADPTDPSRSSPLPYTPPPNTQQRYAESPDDYGFESTPPLDKRQERLQNGAPRASPLGGHHHQQQQVPQNSSLAMAPSPHQPNPGHYEAFSPKESNCYRYEDNDIPNHMPQDEYAYDEPVGYGEEYPDPGNSRPPTQISQTSQGMIHSTSSPAMIDARPRQNAPYPPQFSATSPSKSYSYDENPAHLYHLEDTQAAPPHGYIAPLDDHEPPPPPPVHRNSGSRPSAHSQGRGPPEQYAPVQATAPLNIRNGRGSINGSPLSQVQINPSYTGYPPSTSPSNSQIYSQPAPSISSHTSYSQLRNQPSQSLIRDYGQSMPPSLVPGYEPSIAEDESERIMHETRMSARHHHNDPPRPQFQQAPVPIEPPRPQYQQVPTPIDPQRPPYQQAPVSTPQSRPQPRPRNIENVQDRRAHRSSAPVIQSHTASPDPRTPVRKSVSPHPDSAPAARPHSGIPFSPDSFDAFNPSISAAHSVNDPGARYNTPEQAKEASRQHERQEKLGDGPIIGSDGRIIDPSDHLPTDTWAPEPEQKAPKKGPQVTMRFRHSPQGAQPMPAARRPAVEHAMSSPVYTQNQNQTPPSGASRARLQKRPGAALGQPASSPLVPTLNTTPRSSPLRPSEPSYPLRERENYGGYGSSPTYGRSSTGNIPPPIPGKVPIDGGQEDWDASALSEEMRRIDIGVSGGRGRQRRSRFGF